MNDSYRYMYYMCVSQCYIMVELPKCNTLHSTVVKVVQTPLLHNGHCYCFTIAALLVSCVYNIYAYQLRQTVN